MKFEMYYNTAVMLFCIHEFDESIDTTKKAESLAHTVNKDAEENVIKLFADIYKE